MTLGMLAILLAEGGGSGPFSVNPGLIIWTWIVFLVFLFFFRKTFWVTIVSRAEEREKTIAGQLAEAERLNAEAKALLAEQQKASAEAKSAAQSLLAEARAAAEKERAHGVEKGRLEQEALLDRARRDIAAERDKALVELRREAVELALGAASKVIGQRLDAESDRKIVLDYLAKAGGNH
ncbi:MAG: F0F1 ATP synthase subunit B [Gemmatimonadetes bacterium]|nr:F0F1 ATP synthase subunit B [Gemmatimonadota bacterium]